MSHFDRAALAHKLTAETDALPFALTEEEIASLLDFLALLAKWNKVYNLTAVREPEQMLTQHVLDCLAVCPAFTAAHRVLDVGAGGGLPGMVLAIWARRYAPDMRVSLIDTVHKKTAFLTQVKAELGLTNVTVLTGRVEELLAAEKFDVITSRAFAELADFVNWSGHLLEQDGRFIAMKGIAPHEEITRLPQGWAVTAVQALAVPGLQAERHLVIIERQHAAG